MDNGLAYDQAIEVDFDKLNPEHQYVLNDVGRGKEVLEVACHTGYVSNWLQKNENKVTGIELYQPALDKAKPYLTNAIQGNIEDVETWQELKSQKFDVILFMHILEHLIDPKKVLEYARGHLKEGGKIVICIPNISNWNSRVNLFKGNFSYTETGLMDKTHLRFVNYFTMRELIEETGFRVIKYGCVSKAYFTLVPNWKLIWRLNKPYDRLMHWVFKKKPNLTDVVLNFTIQSDEPG